MPVDGAGVMGGFEQGLIVKKLNVWTYQIFYYVENLLMEEEITIMDVTLAHLHDLKHLTFGVDFLFDIIGVFDGEITKFVTAASGEVKFLVILAPQ